MLVVVVVWLHLLQGNSCVGPTVVVGKVVVDRGLVVVVGLVVVEGLFVVVGQVVVVGLIGSAVGGLVGVDLFVGTASGEDVSVDPAFPKPSIIAALQS